MSLTSFFKVSGLIFLHILAVAVILMSLQPLVNWYLNAVPARGVDLYNSATYVAYHLKYFSLPFNSFKDIWFGGYPFMSDFPQLAFYLMVPFGAYFGSHFGVQVFSMVALILLAFFCYLLFFHLSRNLGLSAALTIAVMFSPNLYGDLTWAGSIPYFISQALFPLVLLLGIKYFEKPNVRRLSGVILISGISILIHPLSATAFYIPSLLILVLFGGVFKLSIIKNSQHILIFIIGILLAAFTFTNSFIMTFIFARKLPTLITAPSPSASVSETSLAIANFYKSQITLLFTDTNIWIFIFLLASFVFFILSLFLFRAKQKFLMFFALLLIAGYVILHPVVNFAGIFNILRHEPYRAFWPIPIALGTLSAYFFGCFFSKLKLPKIGFNLALALILNLAFGALFYFIYINNINAVISRIDFKSEHSSAFPEVLNFNLRPDKLEKLKKEVVPSFIDPKDKNKRLYSADATVNIWWNSFFDMPLARGYLDPPIGTDRRGGLFWLDIAIANDSLVRDFKATEEKAFNNALFLIDWYGINYFEGGRLSSKGPNPGPSSYLTKNNIFDNVEDVVTHGVVLKWQTESGKPEIHPELPQNLKFYKVADQYASAVLAPTNAPAILVFSDWPGYEDVLRVLGDFNLNSKKLIPVYGGKFVDQFDFGHIDTFKAVILHNYDFSNEKVFNKLLDYVKRGGKVFVDTGSEVKHSQSNKLPEIFPMKSLQRTGLGRQWELQISESEFLQDVDLSSFGPLIFNNNEWNLSTPQGDDLREGSSVVIAHKERPVLINRKIGAGEVLWSGFNLVYHINQYKSESESKLFFNMLTKFVTFGDGEVPLYKVQWIKPEKIRFKADQETSGVLLKEEGYPGWSAHTSTGKNLPIYLAGPTYPGFMYVPLGGNAKQPQEIEFEFTGDKFHWFAAIVNLLVIILLLDIAIFNGIFVGKRLALLFRRGSKNVGYWWKKEDEE